MSLAVAWGASKKLVTEGRKKTGGKEWKANPPFATSPENRSDTECLAVRCHVFRILPPPETCSCSFVLIVIHSVFHLVAEEKDVE